MNWCELCINYHDEGHLVNCKLRGTILFDNKDCPAYKFERNIRGIIKQT